MNTAWKYEFSTLVLGAACWLGAAELSIGSFQDARGHVDPEPLILDGDALARHHGVESPVDPALV